MTEGLDGDENQLCFQAPWDVEQPRLNPPHAPSPPNALLHPYNNHITVLAWGTRTGLNEGGRLCWRPSETGWFLAVWFWRHEYVMAFSLRGHMDGGAAAWPAPRYGASVAKSQWKVPPLRSPGRARV